MEEKSKEEYKGVWVLGEVRDGEIHAVSYELLAWGRELADKLQVDLTVLVLGHNIRDKARELIYGGADRVMVVDHSALAYFTVDPFAAILTALIHEEKPEILIASATTMGRTLMPVLAVKVSAGLTADCTELDIDMQERLAHPDPSGSGGQYHGHHQNPGFQAPDGNSPAQVQTAFGTGQEQTR